MIAPGRGENNSRSGKVFLDKLTKRIPGDVTQIPVRGDERVPQPALVRRRVRRLHQQRLRIFMQLLHLLLQILHHLLHLVILQRRIQRTIQQQLRRLRKPRL